MADTIQVEVAFATPERQFLQALEVPSGTTAGDAIRLSGIAARCRNVELDALPAGIWGRLVSREQRLEDGDRVELYRPLEIDPREARRKLAEAGQTMAGGAPAPADRRS